MPDESQIEETNLIPSDYMLHMYMVDTLLYVWAKKYGTPFIDGDDLTRLVCSLINTTQASIEESLIYAHTNGYLTGLMFDEEVVSINLPKIAVNGTNGHSGTNGHL